MDSRYLRGKVDGVDGWSTVTVAAQTGPSGALIAPNLRCMGRRRRTDILRITC